MSDIEGLVQPGNVDLANRPRVKNPDGSISTVRSQSFNINGLEVLLPTVSDAGELLDERAALREFYKTGKHLGMFASPAHATAYAKRLHEDQAKLLER